jgi:TolA-binding protein
LDLPRANLFVIVSKLFSQGIMRSSIKRLPIILGVCCLMACSTQELSDKIAKLERNVTDLRSYQAEQTDTINAMDSQLKIVSGRLEEIEFSQNKRLGTDLSSLRDDLSSLKRRVPPPSIVPSSELEVDEVWANSLPAEPAQIFSDSLQRLREGKFTDALPLLQNVVEQLEGSDKAGVALFWQGVAYDGNLDDRGALRSYAEGVSRYPKSPRAPGSLLRQAQVLIRLEDRKAAALTLQKLVADYPRSPEGARAKEQLRELR